MKRTEKKTAAHLKKMTTVEQELSALRQDIQEIKSILAEEYELSPRAKKALRDARKTPESQYVDLT